MSPPLSKRPRAWIDSLLNRKLSLTVTMRGKYLELLVLVLAPTRIYLSRTLQVIPMGTYLQLNRFKVVQRIMERAMLRVYINNDIFCRYKAKFGFPFIICARENKVASIMEGLQSRYNNTLAQEILTAVGEIKKICRLRILDLVKDD